VLIDVEAKDRRYQQMHVDGGASAQVFVYPRSFSSGSVRPPPVYSVSATST